MMRLLLLVLVVLFSVGTHAEVVVTDDLDRKLVLEQSAKRIVALAPHIVENLYSAGAGEQLVAVVDYSDHPPQASDLPQLGSAQSVSVEAILATDPDLVIMWATGNNQSVRRHLERLNIPVYVDEPRTLEDVARSIRVLGELAGTEAQAKAAAGDYLRRLETLSDRYFDKSPVSVFYQVWNQPLQTLNGEHLVSDVIRLCGGRNAYADAKPLAPKINLESVLERDPQMIVASGMDAERPEWLDEWKQWPELTAVKQENLFFVPPDIIQRHTARILDGAEQFCKYIEKARIKSDSSN